MQYDSLPLFTDWTSILGSLGGVSYYGPVGGHGFVSHELQAVREEREYLKQQRHVLRGGPVQAVLAGPESSHWVRVFKVEEEEKPEIEGAEGGEESKGNN